MLDREVIEIKERVERLRIRLAESDFGCFIVTNLNNLLYLTGMRSSAGAALIDEEKVVLIIDGRYITVAEELADLHWRTGLQVVQVDGSYDETIVMQVLQGHFKRLGVESEHLSIKRFRWFEESLKSKCEIRETIGLIEDLREVKGEFELSCLRTGGRLLARVADESVQLVKPGRREREIAFDIDRCIENVGFEALAFDTIVASGCNSALPHAKPTERRIKEGDLVVLDFGGRYSGYCVDMTRTVAVGNCSEELIRMRDGVREAHSMAIDSVRPGVRASEVDRVARDVLGRYGLADKFVHSTGHGLGLEVHESPRLAPAVQLEKAGLDRTLRNGMVFTVEPGVYQPGVGGVRIEDDIEVTDNGCQVLTATRLG
tara:strand:+ start:14727 stop:15845 length:1119 start_codon:yes stop_codon:yes gene_type:complete